ncbi:hypothetical protein JX266_013698 [Neoarthrinium moseri]|nr:hypothetical protein JX266_013698 [Neoarthrinium moseri]
MSEQLYVPNKISPSQRVPNKEALLTEALENIVTGYPPRESYDIELKGFWNGPTGIAYLFLCVSVAYPRLEIASKSALHWAEAYSTADGRTEATIQQASQRCGISAQLISYQAVRAAVTKDMQVVDEFVQSVSVIPSRKHEDEWLWGMAGALYLIRVVRHWVPASAKALEEPTSLITEAVIANGPDWECNNHQWLGAAHGDIGIVTELVLTSPSVAPRLEKKLGQLLDLQTSDGNWAVIPEPKPHHKPYVQFCHGAPGFVLSLRSLRPHFPGLQDRIDRAINLGSELVWKEGVLRKEPSLCHGIFGNALALMPDQRDHLLAQATPDSVAKARAADPTMFEESNYGFHYALFTGYWPSAAWAWFSSTRQESSLIGYNDV